MSTTPSPRLLLAPHPVTRPWCGGPGVMFSWETMSQGRAACGVSATEHAAMRAVTQALHRYGGEGIVQRCVLGPYDPESPDQYAYGDVVARARLRGDVVEWTGP